MPAGSTLLFDGGSAAPAAPAAPAPAVSLAALRALGAGHTLPHAAHAHALNLQALSALVNPPGTSALPGAPGPIPTLSGLAQLDALRAAYAGGLGAGFSNGTLGAGVSGAHTGLGGTMSALHALGVLGGLPGAAAGLGSVPARAQSPLERRPPRASDSEAPPRSAPAEGASKDAARSDTPPPVAAEKKGGGATGTLKASLGENLRKSPEPPARAPRANPFGAEPEGYSLVHAAKRARRDAIAVASLPGAEAAEAEG